MDSLCTEAPAPLASLGFGLCCCRSTLARSSSTDRANASQFVKSKGRGIFACQYESRGVQYLQQDCRTGSCTGSAVERRKICCLCFVEIADFHGLFRSFCQDRDRDRGAEGGGSVKRSCAGFGLGFPQTGVALRGAPTHNARRAVRVIFIQDL